MPHYWIPNSAREVRIRMLKELGVNNIEELFKDIPSDLRLKKPLKIGFGRPLTEYEVRKVFMELMSRNRFKGFQDLSKLFIGGGVCAHYIPSVVKSIISRAEFYTAYTPYQSEINQGLLQAFFEYQSLMAELYGVDVVNASMYNGSTAAAEAVRLALRVKRGRRKVLVAGNSHPEIIEVIKTWVEGLNTSVDIVRYSNSGELDLNDLSSKLGRDVAAVYMETPNFFGVIEGGIKEAIDLTHECGALAIVNSDPISLGVLEGPGNLGADIVVGDAHSLGLGLNFGGPSAGILGVQGRRELIRQLPGRLIGMTKELGDGRTGYTMILQTREQHIRRERATSNITTNSGLEALAAAVYVSLLGSKGLRELGLSILGRTEYLVRRVKENLGNYVTTLFTNTRYFMEVPLKVKGVGVDEVIRRLSVKGYYVGPPLKRFNRELSDCFLVCVTEVHGKDDIDGLINALVEVVGSA